MSAYIILVLLFASVVCNAVAQNRNHGNTSPDALLLLRKAAQTHKGLASLLTDVTYTMQPAAGPAVTQQLTLFAQRGKTKQQRISFAYFYHDSTKESFVMANGKLSVVSKKTKTVTEFTKHADIERIGEGDLGTWVRDVFFDLEETLLDAQTTSFAIRMKPTPIGDFDTTYTTYRIREADGMLIGSTTGRTVRSTAGSTQSNRVWDITLVELPDGDFDTSYTTYRIREADGMLIGYTIESKVRSTGGSMQRFTFSCNNASLNIPIAKNLFTFPFGRDEYRSFTRTQQKAPKQSLTPPPPPVPIDTVFSQREITALDGSTHPLYSPQAKATFLFFWRIGCRYSELAQPEVQKLAEEFQAKGVAFRGLNVVDTSASQVGKYLQRSPISMPVFMNTQPIADEFKAGAPSFAILDRNGRLRYYLFGYTKGYGVEKQWRDTLEKLLAE